MCIDVLVKRLARKYPTQKIYTNVDYYDGDHHVGEVDVLRKIKPNHYVMYEVKTGQAKINKARQQYYRFVNHNPEDTIRGVYVHPKKVQRLK